MAGEMTKDSSVAEADIRLTRSVDLVRHVCTAIRWNGKVQ